MFWFDKVKPMNGPYKFNFNPDKLFNYSIDDFKAELTSDKPFNYIVLDNVICEELFSTFRSFNKLLTKSQPGTIFNEGKSYHIGGGASKSIVFDDILTEDTYKDMLTTINEFYNYDLIAFWCEIFDVEIKKDFFIGNKLSAYSSKYGWHIHPDGPSKVISLIFYYDPNTEPIDSLHNGTQLYTMEKKYSIQPDIDLTLGQMDGDHEYIHKEFLRKDNGGGIYEDHELNKIYLHKNIHFKPNRMVAFKNWYNSYHGIYPMKLKSNTLRYAFQWNIWTTDRYE